MHEVNSVLIFKLLIMKTFNVLFLAIIMISVTSCHKEELEYSPTETQLQETKYKGNLQNIRPNEAECFFFKKKVTVSNNPGIDKKGIVSFRGQLWAVILDASTASGHRAGVSEMWSSNDGKRWMLRKRYPFNRNGRKNASLVVHNNRMWMLGGADGANQALIDIWSSANGIDWKLEAFAPFNLRNRGSGWEGGVTTFQNKIFVFTKSYENKEVLAYSSSDGKHWALETANLFGIDPSEGAIQFDKTVVLDDKLYAFGIGPNSGFGEIRIFSTDNGSYWNEPVPSARLRFGEVYGSSVTQYKGLVWFIGGQDGGRNVYSRIWYTSDMQTWTKYHPKIKSGSIFHDVDGPSIYGHTTIPFDDELLIFGGFTEYDYNHKMWTLYEDCIEQGK